LRRSSPAAIMERMAERGNLDAEDLIHALGGV
jgi:hypothetical protein